MSEASENLIGVGRFLASGLRSELRRGGSDAPGIALPAHLVREIAESLSSLAAALESAQTENARLRALCRQAAPYVDECIPDTGGCMHRPDDCCDGNCVDAVRMGDFANDLRLAAEGKMPNKGRMT